MRERRAVGNSLAFRTRYTYAMPRYNFSRPALSVDIVLVAGPPHAREVLLVLRRFDPYSGEWALPGGFVEEGERLRDAVLRELAEETGVEWDGPMQQVAAYGDPGRDPRGWTVSVAWVADAGESPPSAVGGDDAAEAAWHRLDDLPRLAFDHSGMIVDALSVLGIDGSSPGH
ncbi:MAG: NUDIX hydrolase [Actinomycetota bacterium]|nr:NUDIX hydrolase [Actinomycetota bacterium]